MFIRNAFSSSKPRYIPQNIHPFEWLCDVLVMLYVWIDWYDLLTYILQGYFTHTWTVAWSPQCQWSNPKRYGENRLVPIHQWIHGITQHIAYLHSSPPSAAYMRRLTGSALVKVMTCRRIDDKQLPEPMQPYCQLDPCEQTSVKFQSKF